MSGELDILVPLAGMALIFGALWLITNHLTARAQAQSSPNSEFQKLAEEAIAGQKELLEETRRLAANLADVQRLLQEV